MKIELSHPHKLPYPTARARAEEIAIAMADKYSIAWHWEASTIHFAGKGRSSGVRGFLVVGREVVRIVLELPMLLWGFKAAIQTSVEEYLQQLDDPQSAGPSRPS